MAGGWRFSLLPLGPAWWVSSMMVGRLVAGQGPVPGREQSSGSAADWSECGNMLERGTEAATAPPPCNNNTQYQVSEATQREYLVVNLKYRFVFGLQEVIKRHYSFIGIKI